MQKRQQLFATTMATPDNLWRRLTSADTSLPRHGLPHINPCYGHARVNIGELQSPWTELDGDAHNFE
jgi:hypothetical protein